MAITQRMRILHHLEEAGSITAKEAMDEYGIMRLSARINELKDAGYKVCKIMENSENRFGEQTRYARYYLGGA